MGTEPCADLLGDRAEQHVIDARSPMRAHHDHAGAIGSRFLQDLASGVGALTDDDVDRLSPIADQTNVRTAARLSAI
jgi:hypothetical protein